MAEPFLSEIRIFGFNFPPRGWAQCDGQILPIDQNQSLYSLLGTTYGGYGETSFALPDLRGRAPVHLDWQFPLGQKGGVETVTLQSAQMPTHDHGWPVASTNGDAPVPTGASLAAFNNGYRDATNLVDLKSTAASAAGGQPHDNMQPWLAINACIAITGLFPSRN